jgi:hypothetical protein
MRLLGVLTVVTALVLTGCGDDQPPPSGGDVPITQRAIAAIALEHAPDDTSRRAATYTDRSSPRGALGADLRYHGDGESDGKLLQILLTPGHRLDDLCTTNDAGCESRPVDGGTLTLAWQREVPEADPGIVLVTMQRDHEAVAVSWSGDVIDGDPRELDLEIPVHTLEAIAQDPRISLTTTQDVVAAGERLDAWDGGEPDPRAYDRVPSTDRGVAWAYWGFLGGSAYYHHLRPSPLAQELGPGAIGGRFEQDRTQAAPMIVDVLAGSRRPAWLSDELCRTPRFAGHCRETPGRRGPRYLAWVPGPPQSGEIWGFSDRGDELVVVRYSHLAVPRDRSQVETAVDWYLVHDLLDDRRLGLETDREVLDAHR